MKKIKNIKRKKILVPKFQESEGFYTTQKHSFLMRKIKSGNTKAELLLRKTLWAEGFRYRLHFRNILGKPDLIFVSKKVAVFVDGDFWHGYNWEERKKKLKTNRAYWIPKIERNMQRDQEVNRKLKDSGWTVVRFWEHQIKNNLGGCINYMQSIYGRIDYHPCDHPSLQ